MIIERRFRSEFTRLFTPGVGRPCLLMLDVLANVADRRWSGSGLHISTAACESSLGKPKHTKTNKKDVAQIVVCDIAIQQVCSLFIIIVFIYYNIAITYYKLGCSSCVYRKQISRWKSCKFEFIIVEWYITRQFFRYK